MDRIPTEDLRVEHVPRLDDGDAIATFAHTFDGYQHFGDDWGRLMNETRDRWAEDGSLPADIDHLRACLFLAHRRERFVDLDIVGLSEPDERGVRTILHGETPASREHERYKHALIQRIAEILAPGSTTRDVRSIDNS